MVRLCLSAYPWKFGRCTPSRWRLFCLESSLAPHGGVSLFDNGENLFRISRTIVSRTFAMTSCDNPSRTRLTLRAYTRPVAWFYEQTGGGFWGTLPSKRNNRTILRISATWLWDLLHIALATNAKFECNELTRHPFWRFNYWLSSFEGHGLLYLEASSNLLCSPHAYVQTTALQNITAQWARRRTRPAWKRKTATLQHIHGLR